jgi:hypothetical protein
MFKKGISYALLQKVLCEQILYNSAACTVQATNPKKNIDLYTICLASGLGALKIQCLNRSVLSQLAYFLRLLC